MQASILCLEPCDITRKTRRTLWEVAYPRFSVSVTSLRTRRRVPCSRLAVTTQYEADNNERGKYGKSPRILLIHFLQRTWSTYQNSIRFANSPHVDFVILSTSDQDSGGLLSNFEAVDIGRVCNELLCNLVVKDDTLMHKIYIKPAYNWFYKFFCIWRHLGWPAWIHCLTQTH